MNREVISVPATSLRTRNGCSPPSAGSAAEDEAPLPAEGGAPDDGLTPLFTAPEFDED